ncbi:MAG: pyridoxine 5'-phosphate synthase [candidate division Zixibacteria bacterium]
MATLTVRLDPIAILREGHSSGLPDPGQATVLVELAGADGISMCLRRDRRFLRERDMYILKELVKTRLEVQIPPVDAMIDKVLEVRPWMVTFAADQADSDAAPTGIDFVSAGVDFSDIATRFKAADIEPCFMIEPDSDSVRGAAKAGATAVLINCRQYGEARSSAQAQTELDRIDRTAGAAVKAGLNCRIDGSLDLRNIVPLIELGLINDFVVGHSLAARAILLGYHKAVTEMMQLVQTVARG